MGAAAVKGVHAGAKKVGVAAWQKLHTANQPIQNWCTIKYGNHNTWKYYEIPT